MAEMRDTSSQDHKLNLVLCCQTFNRLGTRLRWRLEPCQA